MNQIDFYLEQNSLCAVHTVAFGISPGIIGSNNSLTKEKGCNFDNLGVFSQSGLNALLGGMVFKTGAGSW